MTVMRDRGLRIEEEMVTVMRKCVEELMAVTAD